MTSLATSLLVTTDKRHDLAPSLVWGLLFFLSLAFLLPLWLTSLVPLEPGRDPAALVAQYSVVGYSALRLSTIASRGRPDWVSLILFGYSYTWLGVAPTLQYLAAKNPLGTSVDHSIVVIQSLLVLLGLIAYDLGLGSTVRRRARSTAGFRTRLRQATAGRYLSRRRVAVLGIATVILTPVFVQYLGGLEVLFTSRQARNEFLFSGGYYSSDSKATGAILTSVTSVLPFVALYSIAFLFISQSRVRQSGRWIALLLLVICSNILLNNPISSSRFWFLVIVLSLLFLFPWSRSQAGVRSITGGFVIGSIFVFPYLDAFRYTNAASTPSESGVVGTMLNKTDYDSMPQVGNLISYVHSNGFSFGDNLLGSVFFMVPRSVWPSKPIDTGSVLAEYIRYGNANLSAPLWGELYLSFGVVGVAVGFWALGRIYGRFSTSWNQGFGLTGLTTQLSISTFFMIPVAVYLVLILRGSLLQSMSRFVVVVLLLWICTARTRTSVLGDAPSLIVARKGAS
ncbi:O-antigen polymerase [Williamsia muralis]|uniref:O-antigen polymerase n=1 Tax=Williamsia marianensis TaxID=85044 RepID=UPI00381F6F02